MSGPAHARDVFVISLTRILSASMPFSTRPMAGSCTLSAANWFQGFFLNYLSRPRHERVIYRAIRKVDVRSMVEIGVGNARRTQRLLESPGALVAALPSRIHARTCFQVFVIHLYQYFLLRYHIAVGRQHQGQTKLATLQVSIAPARNAQHQICDAVFKCELGGEPSASWAVNLAGASCRRRRKLCWVSRLEACTLANKSACTGAVAHRSASLMTKTE